MKKFIVFIIMAVILFAVGCDNGKTGHESDTLSVSDTEIKSETDSATESESESHTETESEKETDTDSETATEHLHNWVDANCTTPKTCSDCGDTEGEALGHVGGDVSCKEKPICDRCQEEYGEKAEHVYEGQITTPEYLSTYATMARPATYFYSCIYCGGKTAKRFAHGGTIPEMLSQPYEKINSEDIDGEYYLFFTDPHSVNTEVDAQITDEKMKRLESLGEFFKMSNAQFAICGGDWFNRSNSRESAIAMMVSIRSKMTELFGEKSYLVLGNHDYNYQTKDPVTGKTVAGDQRLTDEEIVSAWFSEYGKTYYTFTSEASRFYVFDSGIDWGHHDELTDKDKEQVEWFLSELEKNDDNHIVLAPHMVQVAAGKLHPATFEYAKIGNAYNTRGIYEYNGRTYDFSQKNGMVEYIIAGHNHESSEGNLNGIPYVITSTMASGEYPTSDFVFADYSSRKLFIQRIGNGEGREIDLLPLTENE